MVLTVDFFNVHRGQRLIFPLFVPCENLIKAKYALGLDVGPTYTKISGCLNKATNLTEVCEAVSKPFDALHDLKDTP